MVGGGPAGLCSAWLLTRMGAAVEVIEASTRIGGRIDSNVPVAGDPARFELGAMRVPPSEQLFQYFWNTVFSLPQPTAFPDPGDSNRSASTGCATAHKVPATTTQRSSRPPRARCRWT
ncbi:FAD/NAD(P)-binding protein [Variovorax robiniae]|uniref:FAD/NAD(P)-binding protein n=1 Tax=Variovorax robiniae TaxID=1836199 RepID=A0ABU8X0E3_9BURK